MKPESTATTSHAEIRVSTVRVLDYILRLDLTQARWDRVDGILEIAAEAAAAGDAQALHAAMSRLRTIGPARVIRIGAAPVGPPPLKIRERAELVRAAVEIKPEEGDDGPDWC